jgi:hypothetical protein
VPGKETKGTKSPLGDATTNLLVRLNSHRKSMGFSAWGVRGDMSPYLSTAPSAPVFENNEVKVVRAFEKYGSLQISKRCNVTFWI